MTGGRPARSTVLLTGASGLLGTWLRRTVPAGIDLVGLVHRRTLDGNRRVEADLRDFAATRAAIDRVHPDLVIHAAYRTDEVSIVDATRHVVDAAGAVDADVVFISTDAVFSGDGWPRAEDAAPDPVHDYGRWKARGEALVTVLGAGSAIVRLPLLVSLHPDDHVTARIRHGAASGTATVWFDDEVRQPAMAHEVAEALWRIVRLDRSERTGAWHLPGPERLSRYEIAQRVAGALGLDAATIERGATPASMVRPRVLDLAAARAVEAVGWSPSPILTTELPDPSADPVGSRP